MELLQTDDFYIFVKGEHSLWWDRQTGIFVPKSGWELTNAEDPECLGICYGIIGQVEHISVFDSRLILIRECVQIGKIHNQHPVYKIKAISFLQLGTENKDLHLHQCHKHKSIRLTKQNSNLGIFDISKSTTFTKTWGTIKNASNTIKNTAAIATGLPKKNVKDKEKFEKRIIEEFHKIFTDTDSFYFCPTCDITNSLQRLCIIENNLESSTEHNAFWKNIDDRFFWNKYMLRELISINNPLIDPWILPIIQGYVQIDECKVELSNDYQGVKTSPTFEIFTLCIISRRSRFRAGTRYKRRGVDEDGHCANYVETEQIISYKHHEVSFVQVRGSVPVYWSQPGYKYRPPPRIDKGESESQAAFAMHFNKEIDVYGPICIINLVEQTGKERVIWDAYSNHVFLYNSPKITYCTFDFHEYCRGMHFENVSILINTIVDIIRDMNYCWRDRQGHICSQLGVFRVNCIDCLDRTNVVQTALAKAVMEIQFTKLGLISPDGAIPDTIKKTFQLLWANNGDIISKQYAGTNALKGDYTRTGERKFSGIMKDGVNSANRYYLSRFKDSTRQGTIDLMLGNCISEDIFNDTKTQDDEDTVATAEHVKLLIEDCKKMLINEPEIVVGSWGLINSDPWTGDPTETEMDSILILTKDSYFIADYDDQVDKITKYQKVMLKDISLLECGVLDSASLFKTTKNHYCIRINYKIDNESGYYHMFRSTNLRFFNNMAIAIKSEEEGIESLKAICEAFQVSIDIAGFPAVPCKIGQKLDKRKSKVVSTGTKGGGIYLDIVTFPNLTRNVSESQLLCLKSAGSKALSNVTQQFSRLNKLSSPFITKKVRRGQTKFMVGRNDKSSSSDSEEEYENSIFQPSASISLGVSPYSSDNSAEKNAVEEGIELTEATNIYDTFLPSVGIVMGTTNESSNLMPVVIIDDKSSNVDNVRLSSIMQTASIKNSSPEIQIDELKPSTNNLKYGRKLSRSSSDIDKSGESGNDINSIHIGIEYHSEQDIPLNITQSQSESALKTKLSSLASPVANVTKDLVLNPFSKLAKGVQNLGSNLDPRKFAMGGTVRQVTEREMEEHRQMQDKWRSSNTKLIAL